MYNQASRGGMVQHPMGDFSSAPSPSYPPRQQGYSPNPRGSFADGGGGGGGGGGSGGPPGVGGPPLGRPSEGAPRAGVEGSSSTASAPPGPYPSQRVPNGPPPPPPHGMGYPSSTGGGGVGPMGNMKPLNNHPSGGLVSNSTVGVGQLLHRIAQFNEDLTRRPARNTIAYWRTFVNEYFHSNALYKYIVWLNDQQDTRTFQIERSALPRLFYVTYSSGINGSRYQTENPREYALDANTYLLLSPRTRAIFNYANGCKVLMGGSLRVTFSRQLKVLMWEYEAQRYEEFLPKAIVTQAASGIDFSGDPKARDNGPPSGAPAARLDFLPRSEINEFGLPSSVMRCFEITEVVHYMKSLMDISTQARLSPLRALSEFEKFSGYPNYSMGSRPSTSGPPPSSHAPASHQSPPEKPAKKGKKKKSQRSSRAKTPKEPRTSPPMYAQSPMGSPPMSPAMSPSSYPNYPSSTYNSYPTFPYSQNSHFDAYSPMVEEDSHSSKRMRSGSGHQAPSKRFRAEDQG